LKSVEFTYWGHFTFADILGYAGAYFVANNRYSLDRVFIDGEFKDSDGKMFYGTFALNIEEIITIINETSEPKWMNIIVK